ncbi:MAG: hypothetical protein KKH88_00560 [Nanoarchaeota archaeon]|nr:hypothetical protein [Nanoarchaeota archaeon]
MVNLHLHLPKDLYKLFKKGDITKLYSKMYSLAEELANNDSRRYKERLEIELMSRLKNPLLKLPTIRDMARRTFDFWDKRFNFYLNEMKELLKKRLEEDKK